MRAGDYIGEFSSAVEIAVDVDGLAIYVCDFGKESMTVQLF